MNLPKWRDLRKHLNNQVSESDLVSLSFLLIIFLLCFVVCEKCTENKIEGVRLLPVIFLSFFTSDKLAWLKGVGKVLQALLVGWQESIGAIIFLELGLVRNCKKLDLVRNCKKRGLVRNLTL